jgi:hypothetical protein
MPDRYRYRSPIRERDDYDRNDVFERDREERERHAAYYGERGATHDPRERYDMPRYDYGREYDAASERDSRTAERGYRGDAAREYDRTHHRSERSPYANERPYGAAYAGRDRFGYNYDFGGDNPSADRYGYARAGQRPPLRGEFSRQYSSEPPRRFSGDFDRQRDYERSDYGPGIGGRIRRTFDRVRDDMRNWEHRPVVGRDEEIDSRRGYVRDEHYRMTEPERSRWDRDDDDWRSRR